MKQITLLFAILFLFSCKNDNPKIVTLNTDLPEIVPFIEAFNANNETINILIENSKDSDIIIYRGQKDSSNYITKDISSLFKGVINKDIFYTDIINSVINSDGSCYVLPLTFNINGLIYNKNNFSNHKEIDIKKFTLEKDLKFSPFWDKNFIMWSYLSNIPHFNLQQNLYDENDFKYNARIMNNMLLDRKDNWDIKLFNEKYMHLTPQRLIETSIIDYYFYNLTDFMVIDKRYFPNIEFSLLSSNDLIPISDEMIYIGINAKSKKHKENEEILSWMFNIDNQSQFLQSLQNEDTVYHLFNKGLSTLKKVTQETIPKYYPELKGLIPRTNIITTPPELPNLWNSLKSEVFLPMFNEIQYTPENLWNKKYLEYYNDWSKKHNK